MSRVRIALCCLCVLIVTGCQFGRYQTSLSSDGPLGLPKLDIDKLPEQWEP